MHYGTKTHSGRYPWGSGENPYQRLGNGSFRARVKELRDSGMSDTEIARNMGISTGAMRQLITHEKNEEDLQKFYRIRELKEKGYANTKIAEMIGVTEGTVRNFLKSDKEKRINQLHVISDQLEKAVNEKKYIDVGEGANLALNCTDTKMQAAIALLRSQGYEYHTIYIDQLGTNHKTTVAVLCPPGTEKSELYNNLDKIHEIDESRTIAVDGTVRLGEFKPKPVDRSRIMVRYGEEGGADKDGTIELRRGVDDISLGNAHYAQVRIAVSDGEHDDMFMKGMAFYSDDMPPGIDIIYNSNKPKGSPDYDKVFKVMKRNKETGELDPNPFGATIKGIDDPSELKLTRREYTDKDGKIQQSCINVVNEEGTWGGSSEYKGWSNSLSSQFLSKQTVPLAKRQLDLAYNQEASKLDDILKITEPTVKRALLEDFADGCDAAAVDLKAAAMPRQRTQVLLPLTSLKENEIYAPNYNNGEKVILVRHPHGGTFEIPELIVNNNNKEGKKIIGQAPDAVGIGPEAARRLSGADFDGDTAIVIPSNNVKFKIKDPESNSALRSLKNFDMSKYALPEDKDANGNYIYPTIKNKTKQTEMGKVTNLITDMTLIGAPDEDIVRAVKHSMVVIDAEKHRYDIKQSFLDNNIAELKTKYQGGPDKGAATIISKASSTKRIDEVKDYYYSKNTIDPRTGEKIYTKTGPVAYDDKGNKIKDDLGHTVHLPREYEEIKKVKDKKTGKVIDYIPTGKMKRAQTETTYMADAKDAYDIIPPSQKGKYPMETAYGDHANKMKALANRARKEWLAVEDRPYNPSAAKAYASEVKTLDAKLLLAQKNAPRERQAQMLANSDIKAEIAANPELKDDKDRLKKIKGQRLAAARARVGAKKDQITFTDREWEAIQSGAIKKTKLEKIINNANKDEVKQRSTPKANLVLTSTKIATIKAMANRGYTQAEIATALGISASTVNKALT